MGEEMKKVIPVVIGIIAIIIAAVLILGGTLGSNESFLKDYTKGYMDITYLGDKTLYSRTTDITDDEASQMFKESVEIESGYFIEYFELKNLTDEQNAQLNDLIKDVYKKTKYEITEVKETETDKYEISLKISPLNMIKVVEDELMKKIEIATEDITADNVWNQMIINILKDNIGNIGYFEDEIVIVKIFQNMDHLYEFEQDSLTEVDSKVIKYDYDVKE